MILALLLAAAAPSTAIDAERAFAADAQKIGQWDAFRKWSTADAKMFVPQPVAAHDFLKGKQNPPASVKWSPSQSIVSCDGGVAVNLGPWTSATEHGYFTTIWVRQPDRSWKWIYDSGEPLARPLAPVAKPMIKRATCSGKALPLPKAAPLPTGFSGAQGESKDHSLHWTWTVSPRGDRRFAVQLWNGSQFIPAVAQRIAAPK